LKIIQGDISVSPDESLLPYAQSRPEFQDFFNLYTFFYKFLINRQYIDLRTIKLVEESIQGKVQKGKTKEIKVEHERTVSELIQYISSGDRIKPPLTSGVVE